MQKNTCPKCGSTNIQKESSYARIKHEGQPSQKPQKIPNECREENCRYKWYN